MPLTKMWHEERWLTQTWGLLDLGWEVLHKRYHTGERVPTILGPSTQGDDFVHCRINTR